MVFKDAQRLFEKLAGKKVQAIRCYKKHEKERTMEENWMWLVTTDETAHYQILWKIMHKREQNYLT